LVPTTRRASSRSPNRSWDSRSDVGHRTGLVGDRRKFLAEAGTTPLRWLTSQRLAEACRLLETTDLTVQAVAGRTGLGTPANFRLHFMRELNTTPSSYRRLYQGRNRSLTREA
jgi:methylphosphotriester-DNA--protein-cysteine methyltransferase